MPPLWSWTACTVVKFKPFDSGTAWYSMTHLSLVGISHLIESAVIPDKEYFVSADRIGRRFDITVASP